MFGKIIELAMKIIGVISAGKVKTKNQATTLVGVVLSIVIMILHYGFGYDVSPDVQTQLNAVILALLFLVWKPAETEELDELPPGKYEIRTGTPPYEKTQDRG